MKEEIVNKYWIAYKLMSDERFGANTSINIEQPVQFELKFNVIDINF